MILKLCGPATDLFVQVDEIQTERLAAGMSVRAFRGGVEVAGYLLAEDGYSRAYVMEGGKTVDRIQA